MPLLRFLLIAWALTTGATAALANPANLANPVAPSELPLHSMGRRVLACTACHGAQGRSQGAVYLPRIAGKPAGYLYQQLLNFRDGQRRHDGMARLLAPLNDAYLRDIAEHFASLDLPHALPEPSQATAAQLARGRQLVLQGDAARQLPACVACHGQALTGRAPALPGLLGLPRSYLAAQLGAWRAGTRRATAPDCMAQLARRLTPEDIAALADWLAAQPMPASARAPLPAPDAPPLPLDCGGVAR